MGHSSLIVDSSGNLNLGLPGILACYGFESKPLIASQIDAILTCHNMYFPVRTTAPAATTSPATAAASITTPTPPNQTPSPQNTTPSLTAAGTTQLTSAGLPPGHDGSVQTIYKVVHRSDSNSLKLSTEQAVSCPGHLVDSVDTNAKDLCALMCLADSNCGCLCLVDGHTCHMYAGVGLV